MYSYKSLFGLMISAMLLNSSPVLGVGSAESQRCNALYCCVYSCSVAAVTIGLPIYLFCPQILTAAGGNGVSMMAGSVGCTLASCCLVGSCCIVADRWNSHANRERPETPPPTLRIERNSGNFDSRMELVKSVPCLQLAREPVKVSPPGEDPRAGASKFINLK